MSSRAVLLGGGVGLTGLYLRRKRLFRSVTRPAPSTLTLTGHVVGPQPLCPSCPIWWDVGPSGSGF